MQKSIAVNVGRAHIGAWSNHDWDKTKALLAPDVHVIVASLQKPSVDLTGIEAYMGPKIKAAQLIEPGSVRELSAIGDEHSALITVTMRIALGPDGSMVTLARSLLYLLDENKKIKEERDQYFILSE